MFFVVSGLALAVVAVILLRGTAPAAIGVIVFSLLAAGIVGLAAVGVLGPLVGLTREHGPTIGGRARIALERDKALTLRASRSSSSIARWGRCPRLTSSRCASACASARCA